MPPFPPARGIEEIFCAASQRGKVVKVSPLSPTRDERFESEALPHMGNLLGTAQTGPLAAADRPAEARLTRGK